MGCYLKLDEIEQLAYIGVVHLVQDSLIQIRIVKDMGISYGIPNLNDLEVKPVVPLSALNMSLEG